MQEIAGAARIVIAFAIARDLYTGLTLARCISLLLGINFLLSIIFELTAPKIAAVVIS
jgi:hypothetical protein